MHQRAVVPLAVLGLGADGGGGGPDLAAERHVLGVEHDRLLRRHVQGEAPDGLLVGAEALFARGIARGGDGGGGEALQARLVLDEELPGVGGVEGVLRIFLRELGELGLERLEAGAFLGGQVGAGLAEALDRLVAQAGPHAGGGAAGGGLGAGLQARPERGVEGDAGEEGGDLRQHGVVRLAQGGRIGDGLQVGDLAPGEVESLGGVLKGEEGVLESGGRGVSGDGVDPRLGLG